MLHWASISPTVSRYKLPGEHRPWSCSSRSWSNEYLPLGALNSKSSRPSTARRPWRGRRRRRTACRGLRRCGVTTNTLLTSSPSSIGPGLPGLGPPEGQPLNPIRFAIESERTLTGHRTFATEHRARMVPRSLTRAEVSFAPSSESLRGCSPPERHSRSGSSRPVRRPPNGHRWRPVSPGVAQESRGGLVPGPVPVPTRVRGPAVLATEIE